MKLLTNDETFKYVFSYEYVLKDFFDSFLKYIKSKKKVEFNSVMTQSYIIPHNKNIKGYYGDIVGILNSKDIISLELYSTPFTKKDYNKSYAYKCRLYANQIMRIKNNESIIKYEDMKKVISVNLIYGNFRGINNNIVNLYSFRNKVNNRSIDEGNTFMYLVRLDLVNKIRYTKGEAKFITYLRLINAKTIKEMEKYAKERRSRTMIDVVEYVREWNRESNIEGMKRFRNNLTENGKVNGIKESKKEIAQNMLKRNMEIDDISDITGLTKKEVLSLR